MKKENHDDENNEDSSYVLLHAGGADSQSVEIDTTNLLAPPARNDDSKKTALAKVAKHMDNIAHSLAGGFSKQERQQVAVKTGFPWNIGNGDNEGQGGDDSSLETAATFHVLYVVSMIRRVESCR